LDTNYVNKIMWYNLKLLKNFFFYYKDGIVIKITLCFLYPSFVVLALITSD